MKQGIDYYSLDVDFLRDIKIRKIRRACGPQSIEILLCLLGNIYRDNGYYIGWDEDSVFLVADEVGAKEGLVNEVVDKAVQVGFFNQEKFDQFKILTSNGIQQRFKEATSKRKGVKLINQFLVNDDNNPSSSVVNDVNNPTSTRVNAVNNEQSKGKERKVNKNKAVAKGTSAPDTANPLQKLSKIYQENLGLTNPMVEQELEYLLDDFDGNVDVIEEAIKRAVFSQKNFSYAKGIMKRWLAKNIKTMEQVKAEDVQFENNQANKFSNNKPQKRAGIMPDWLKEQKESQQSGQAVTDHSNRISADEAEELRQSIAEKLANSNS